MASVLANKAYSLSVNFIISSNYYFSNTDKTINRLIVDFGNGEGFREYAFNDTANYFQNINYSTFGIKQILIKAVISTGDTLTCISKIDIKEKRTYTFLTEPKDISLTAKIPFNRNDPEFNNYRSSEGGRMRYGKANMRIYFSDSSYHDRKIRKPILIVDGFDPGNQRQFQRDLGKEDKGGILGLLEYDSIRENGTIKKVHVGSELLKKGYDIVLLDFPRLYDTTILIQNVHPSMPRFFSVYKDFGCTYIERNAYTCIVAIDTLNSLLKENGSNEELVIIGPSMGGQITRFALKYMENNLSNRDYRGHNTRLWTSFDSPHIGANISLGAQSFIFSNDNATFLTQLLNPAASEMLLVHRYPTNGEYKQRPLFDRYYNKINNMGFPSHLRKIAIANGSLTNSKTGTASQPVLSAGTLNLGGGPLINIGKIYMAPSYPKNSYEVFIGKRDEDDVIQYTNTEQYGCNYDIAPGGTFSTFKEIYDAIPEAMFGNLVTRAIAIDMHCFMPTKSTLAYSGNNINFCEDLYNYNGQKRDLVAEKNIPFDNYWGSIGSNMGHVKFNASLHEWFNKELNIYIKGERELTLCSTYQYTINNFDIDDTIQWECNDNLQITSDPRNHTLTIKALQLGNGWIRAINSPDYRQDTLAFYQIQVSSTDFIAATETTGNTTWNTSLNIGEDFTVKSGHTLTIQNSTISIAPNVKIKIEPNAKLIVDNSTLTSYCQGNYWGGIEVCGQKSQPQLEQNQGVLIVKNSSIIENSRNAISTWKNDDWSSTGGIVTAENSTFRNNMRSAEFLSYTNTGEMPNVSKFINCTFKWDRNMFPHNKTSLSHVTLWDVRGVRFIGCDFTDNQTIDNSVIKHGIFAEDAGLKVIAKIIPTSLGLTLDKSQFTNLNYGIRVSNTDKVVEIKDSYFENNFTGVFATTVNNLTITTNELRIKPVLNIRELYPTDLAYGVVIDNSIGYKIEQNNFFGEDETLRGTGLQIKNSGGSPIIIKNNKFSDILYSTIAIGKNRAHNDNIGEYVGLKYNCNNFIDTKYGISVIKDKNANNELFYGIDLNQNGGNINQPAENIFDNKEYPLYSDIYIEDDLNTYNYAYNADESNKNPFSISPNVIKCSVNGNTDCSRDFGLLDDLELHNNYIFLENEYLTLLYNYNNLLDGGSKDDLLDKLLDSWEGDIWDLRQAYLDASPYLTPEVLIELALSEKLPLAVYLEVALSNPEGTQKDEYINFMKKEGEILLTPTGIDLIKGSWDTKTFRATLESNISSKLSDMEEVSRTMIYRIINDSTGFNVSDYRNILNSIRNIEAKYELVDSYIGTKEYTSAENLLNILISDPNNEKYNANDINDYLLLLSIMRDRNDTTNQIPIDERLETLSNLSTRAGAKAKAYLYFNNQEIDYHPDYVDLELNEKSKVIRRVTTSLDKLFAADVKISPNPAKDHIILTYNLPPRQIYTIKIYDNKGIELLTKTLKNNKGVQTIELKNLKSGAYYYTITDSKSVIKSDKIIIVK